MLLSRFSYNQRHVKGIIGEEIVKNLLAEQDGFYSFHDVKIFHQQIDHILVCPKGIFTLETKNFHGTIYGNHMKQHWSQVLSYHSAFGTYYKKYVFYNPVMQAKNHSKALYYFLKNSWGISQYVQTIVVFAGSGNIKVYSPIIPVLYKKDLIQKIRTLPNVLSQSACASLAKKIQYLGVNIVHKDSCATA